MLGQLRSWPKLIAAFVACIGVSGIIGAWTFSFSLSKNSITCFWPEMVIAVLLVALSYPLATGRDWARRILVFAVISIGLFFAFWRAIRLFDFPKSFSHSTAEQSRLLSISILLEDVSAFIVIVSVIAFGVLFLSHPDVVASFRRSPIKSTSPDRLD